MHLEQRLPTPSLSPSLPPSLPPLVLMPEPGLRPEASAPSPSPSPSPVGFSSGPLLQNEPSSPTQSSRALQPGPPGREGRPGASVPETSSQRWEGSTLAPGRWRECPMPELRDLRGLFPPPRALGRTPHPQLPRRGENSSEIPTDSPLPRTLRLVTTARMRARRVTRSPTRPGPCPHVLSPLVHPCPRGNSRPSGCSQDPRTWPLLTPCPTPGPRDPCPAQRGDRHESYAERPCRHLAALTLLRAHNSGAGTRRCPHRRRGPGQPAHTQWLARGLRAPTWQKPAQSLGRPALHVFSRLRGSSGLSRAPPVLTLEERARASSAREAGRPVEASFAQAAAPGPGRGRHCRESSPGPAGRPLRRPETARGHGLTPGRPSVTPIRRRLPCCGGCSAASAIPLRRGRGPAWERRAVTLAVTRPALAAAQATGRLVLSLRGLGA